MVAARLGIIKGSQVSLCEVDDVDVITHTGPVLGLVVVACMCVCVCVCVYKRQRRGGRERERETES